jgi:hypothetical protein
LVENVGMAFVTLKDKESVTEVIDEWDGVKIAFDDKEIYEKLKI